MSGRDARCRRGYCAQHPNLTTCTTCRGCYSPHPSIPSAANATRILLDDRNRYWSHAPTSILDRRNKRSTPPNRMPAKHETRRDHPTDSVIRHGMIMETMGTLPCTHQPLPAKRGHDSTITSRGSVDGQRHGIPFITFRRRSNVSKLHGVARCDGPPSEERKSAVDVLV